MSSDIILKVLTLGESTVGKTSIILRYTDNVFHRDQIATIGIDFKNKIFDFKGKKTKLLLWDTAGQERFKNLASQYYKGADGVLIVYDITSKSTFEKTRNWVQQLSEKADLYTLVIYLIGNKSDLPNRQVTYEEGKKFADENNMKFFETSALVEDKKISDMFDNLVNDLFEKNFNEKDEDTPISNIKISKEINEEADRVNKKNKKNCCK